MVPEVGPKDIVVVMGGSAGALEPLRNILREVPRDISASFFVTLHIPKDFPSLLPELLSSATELKVQHPEDGEAIQSGTVYVAPPDRHLVFEDGRIRVTNGARENRHRPAIDPMFRSAARAYGSKVVAIVLSGQLDDGAAGLMAVRMHGGTAIAQDPSEASCPEMPSRAITYAGVDQILPAIEIASFLTSKASGELSTMHSEKPGNHPDKSLPAQEITERIGKPSIFSCPECGGVLWELEEGGLLRFRCRVGHGYTADNLKLAHSDGTEDALWAAARALEEKAALLRRMAERSGRELADLYRDEAEGYDKHVKTLIQILSDQQKNEEAQRKRSDAA